MTKLFYAADREALLALAEKDENRNYIKTNPWEATIPNQSNPVTWAAAAYSDDRLYVIERAYETAIRAETKDHWGEVHFDSCLEFFFSPVKDSGYFNMEVSASGAMKLNFGAGRHGRVSADRDVSLYNPVVTVTDAYWQVVYEIPYSVIRTHVPEFTGKSGDVMYGNFYKCGEQAPYPHFLMWNGLDAAQFPKPDFHRPEFFLPLTLQ